jgi:hypothetical protein
MDCRVKPGNDVIEIRSRDATGHPSYGKHGHEKRENGVQEKAGGGACLGSSLKPASLVIAPGLHFVSSGLRRKKKKEIRRRNADRRNE